MARVTVHHLTQVGRLPLIEVEGLRTRADLSGLLGPPDDEDRAAPGRYAHGRRVSAYLDRDHAHGLVDELGPGYVTFTVDPAKALGVPGAAREGGPEAYWQAARPLEEWLDDADPPADLEVHQPVPVRAKHLAIRSALVGPDDLGCYAPLVEAAADDDRLMAKALMHVAIIASEGDLDSPAFHAAAALAWRDEPDPDDLSVELREVGVDRLASAALAEHGSGATDAVMALRSVLDETREWATTQGESPAEALLVRSSAVLQSALDDGPGGDVAPG